jgi:hypothetical protein
MIECKDSALTLERVRALEGIGFVRNQASPSWEDRLSELADYRKIHGDCIVPRSYNRNTQLASWVEYQRQEYRLYLEGKISHMTDSRIQALESLGFECDSFAANWEFSLSEIAD